MATVHHSFRFVTSLSQLINMEKQLLAPYTSVSKRSKYKQISSQIYEKFLQAPEQHYPVHDKNLITSLEHSIVLQVSDFTESLTCAQELKNRYTIVSRKITRFVRMITTRREHSSMRSSDHQLHPKLCPRATNNPATCYNSDQSGFQKDMHCGRSLNIRGLKKVEAAAQSKHSITYSYNI